MSTITGPLETLILTVADMVSALIIEVRISANDNPLNSKAPMPSGCKM